MKIRRAQPDETELVAQVLTAAAQSLTLKGQPLWDLSEVSAAAIERHVEAGLYFVTSDNDGPVAVFRFQLEDPYFWPEVAQGSSAFVHKIAVHPRMQGREIAQVLLGHACELARQHGRGHLRLDCASGRPKLRSVYERFGFRHHSEKRIGRSLFDRFELEL